MKLPAKISRITNYFLSLCSLVSHHACLFTMLELTLFDPETMVINHLNQPRELFKTHPVSALSAQPVVNDPFCAKLIAFVSRNKSRNSCRSLVHTCRLRVAIGKQLWQPGKLVAIACKSLRKTITSGRKTDHR